MSLTGDAQQRWFELKPDDGFYLPEGTPHQYHNPGTRPAIVLFGVAPSYFPKSEVSR